MVRFFWLSLARKDSLHELLDKLVIYVLSIHAPRSVGEMSGHLAAVVLSYNADSRLDKNIILVVVLRFVVLAIATVYQVLCSISMLIYVHQIAITLEG